MSLIILLNSVSTTRIVRTFKDLTGVAKDILSVKLLLKFMYCLKQGGATMLILTQLSAE